MKESILPLLDRYKNGMVPVTESRETKKPAAKLDKSIKIGAFKDQKTNDVVEVINNNKKETNVEIDNEIKEELVQTKSQESTSPKPSQSPKNLSSATLEFNNVVKQPNLTKKISESSDIKKKSVKPINKSPINDAKYRRFKLFKYDKDDIFKKEELNENDLKDIITQNTHLEQLFTVNLEEVVFYLNKLGVADPNISKYQEMKDVDENYLKMVIGEKVEDVLALLTPD